MMMMNDDDSLSVLLFEGSTFISCDRLLLFLVTFQCGGQPQKLLFT